MHNPGTLYVAANRYQVDDRHPYVYRTTDYGKTWKKIINGIADGHFARSIREDHLKAGLLFLGTEHGVYVSFNAGDNWQPIQLNLPDTPVRDLVIKDNDVVLGTHGRGFWILDDIGPLRQMTTSGFAKEAILFKLADPIRGIYNLKVQYYLKDKQDSVQIEILDAADKVIGTFAGNQVEYKPDPNIPWWRRGGSSKPTVAPGLNEFTWDLRYQGATTFDGMIIWSARPARGPLAVPGKYKVKLSTGTYTHTYPFEIKLNPNLKGVTIDDLQKQFDLASRILEQESAANEAVIDIRKMKKTVNKALVNKADEGLKASANSFIAKITAIEEALYQTKNQSGQDPLNFPIRLNNRLSSLRRSVETGDARPTDAAYVVFKELSAELKIELDKLAVIKTNEWPGLNERLGIK